MRLSAPANSTGLTITNNYGVYSGWSESKNYFAGDVGIGTTIPQEKLHLSGIGTQSIRVDTDGTALSIYNHSEFIGFIGNDAGKLFINAGGTEDTLSLRTNGIEKLRITSAGHIGIGTDNPTFDLHLFRTGDTTFVIESDRPNSDENANPKLVFRQDGGVSASAIGMNFDSDNVGNDLFIANSIASGSIRFLTGSNNGYTNASEALL